MSLEHDNSGQTVSQRGGCLDAAVGVVTFGRYGVETTATYPAEVIKPSNLPTEVGQTVDVQTGTPIEIALRTGKAVMVSDFEEINRPKLTRHIIRNNRLP